MSRPIPSKRTVLSWIKDFPELRFNDVDLLCTSCEKPLPWKRKSDVMRHISSENHKKSVRGDDSDSQRNFNLDLVEVMVGCNIPWIKLDSPLFRQFLQKCVNGQYKNIEVPTESALRIDYLPPTVKKNLFAELTEKHIWLSVNERTNARGRKVLNVVAGGMEKDYSTCGYLIASKALNTTNSRTVADLVQSSLKTLWSEKHAKNSDTFLLFITEELPHMKAAGEILKETYYNMVHMTCLAHGLHSVAETIRECYPNVEKLITCVKEIFLNAPHRIQIFHETIPNTPLPPDPVLTRCGTWLEAVSYYYCNFNAFKLLVQKLDSNESIAIVHAQQMFSDPVIKDNMSYIHGHFSRIPLAIRDLEYKKESEFTIVDAMNVIFDLRQHIFQLSGGVAETVKYKLKTVLKENPGFFLFSCIVDHLNGKEMDLSVPDINVPSLEKFAYFKYAPVTVVDVESSEYKHKWK